MLLDGIRSGEGSQSTEERSMAEAYTCSDKRGKRGGETIPAGQKPEEKIPL